MIQKACRECKEEDIVLKKKMKNRQRMVGKVVGKVTGMVRGLDMVGRTQVL